MVDPVIVCESPIGLRLIDEGGVFRLYRRDFSFVFNANVWVKTGESNDKVRALDLFVDELQKLYERKLHEKA